MNALGTNRVPFPDHSDKQDLAYVLELLAKPEVQQSLTVLLENLPRFTDTAVKLADLYEMVQTLAVDPVFVSDVKGGFQEFAVPVVEKAKSMASLVIEANDRASADTRSVGLFGLLKMLNDPQAQKLFRFMKAFMAVANEREQKK